MTEDVMSQYQQNIPAGGGFGVLRNPNCWRRTDPPASDPQVAKWAPDRVVDVQRLTTAVVLGPAGVPGNHRFCP